MIDRVRVLRLGVVLSVERVSLAVSADGGEQVDQAGAAVAVETATVVWRFRRRVDVRPGEVVVWLGAGRPEDAELVGEYEVESIAVDGADRWIDATCIREHGRRERGAELPAVDLGPAVARGRAFSAGFSGAFG